MEAQAGMLLTTGVPRVTGGLSVTAASFSRPLDVLEHLFAGKPRQARIVAAGVR